VFEWWENLLSCHHVWVYGRFQELLPVQEELY
jgi:hypothetical protein